MGRFEEGLAAVEEAVAVYRVLVARRLDTYRTDLDRSLALFALLKDAAANR
jgi:hypothetical protein